MSGCWSARGRTMATTYVEDGVGGGGAGVEVEAGVLGTRLHRHLLRSSACLSLCLVCGFTPSPPHPPPELQPPTNPPLLTGLSSTVPQDSVSPAVFKIQFRCAIQICFREQRGRQTHYVKKRTRITWWCCGVLLGRGTPERSNAITAETT